MDVSGKTILVTGGAGFIGSTLVPMLLDAGYAVRVLDNMSVGSAAALSEYDVDIQVGDIRDKEAVATAVAGIDGVVHLAAQTGVIDSINAPEMDFEINACGVLNMLIACREQNVPRFVFASSNAPIGGVSWREKATVVHLMALMVWGQLFYVLPMFTAPSRRTKAALLPNF